MYFIIVSFSTNVSLQYLFKCHVIDSPLSYFLFRLNYKINFTCGFRHYLKYIPYNVPKKQNKFPYLFIQNKQKMFVLQKKLKKKVQKKLDSPKNSN